MTKPKKRSIRVEQGVSGLYKKYSNYLHDTFNEGKNRETLITKVKAYPKKVEQEFRNKTYQIGYNKVLGKEIPLSNLQAQQRHRNIAKAYFNEAPTISNLYNGVINYLKGYGVLSPDNTGVATGDVPTPNSIGKVGQIGKAANAIKKITLKNAASIAPDVWTAAQDAAIARGDIKEAQRLRDLHFKIKAPNTKIVDKEGNPLKMIHGSSAKFTAFRRKDNPFGSSGRGMYFGVAPKDLSGWTYGGPNSYKYLVYLNGKGLYSPGLIEKDVAGKAIPYTWINEIIGTEKYSDFVESMSKYPRMFPTTFYNSNNISEKVWRTIHDKYDTKGLFSPKINKIKRWFRKDKKYATLDHNGHIGEIVVRDPEQIKLADAVTYDDNGVRIPLGERDNFNVADMRYGLIPLLLGASGYGYYKANNSRQTYKAGGTIHIKPENRGKFNALKKRTGKTTEELTHSKNPLTRKRAIFAQNARKWNHKKK